MEGMGWHMGLDPCGGDRVTKRSGALQGHLTEVTRGADPLWRGWVDIRGWVPVEGMEKADGDVPLRRELTNRSGPQQG